MLLAYRLVRLIEAHSNQLAEGVLVQLKTSPKTSAYRDIPAEEFKQRVHEIYTAMGEWLLGKTEPEIERRYVEIGRRRAAQGIPLSQVVWAINLAKQHLLEFLASEGIAEKTVEVLGELEVLQLLEQFFDRAAYYAVIGYESSHASLEARMAAGNSPR